MAAAVRIVAIVLVGGLAPGLWAVTLPGSAVARADCRCLYAGHYYNSGELACIRTPNGPRVAFCGKVSNLSSWRFTAERCGPVSRRQTPRQTLIAARPHAAR